MNGPNLPSSGLGRHQHIFFDLAPAGRPDAFLGAKR